MVVSSAMDFYTTEYIFNDRYYLNAMGSSGHLQFQLVDIQNLQVIPFVAQIDAFSLVNRGMTIKDDRIIAAVQVNYNSQPSIYDFDLSAMTWNTNATFNNSTEGIPEDYDLRKIGDRIYLLGQELYMIDQDKLVLSIKKGRIGLKPVNRRFFHSTESSRLFSMHDLYFQDD